MKKVWFVPFVAFALTGCMSAPKANTTATAGADIQLTALLNTAPKKPVSPDQVNDQNAGEIAAALHVELNESQAGAMLPAPDAGSKK